MANENENEDEAIGEQTHCDNCGYPSNKLMDTKKYSGEEYKLCGICYGTFLGHATTYPRQVSDPKLYQSIAHVANLILDSIDRLESRLIEKGFIQDE